MTGLSQLLAQGVSIVLIDLVLGGDNALVIAMAVKALPTHQRKIAIGCGAAAAVLLRIAITIVAARLLSIEFLKMAGGALVIWIAVRVLAEAGGEPEESAGSGSLLRAIWLIVFADITMSIDNVLAVAGAAKGSVPLIIFGLAVSIPFVVFASTLIATLMDRYPIIMYLGAAILGEVGADMVMSDPFVVRTLHPAQWVVYAVIMATIIATVAAGRFLCERRRRHRA